MFVRICLRSRPLEPVLKTLFQRQLLRPVVRVIVTREHHAGDNPHVTLGQQAIEADALVLGRAFRAIHWNLPAAPRRRLKTSGSPLSTPLSSPLSNRWCIPMNSHLSDWSAKFPRARQSYLPIRPS